MRFKCLGVRASAEIYLLPNPPAFPLSVSYLRSHVIISLILSLLPLLAPLLSSSLNLPVGLLMWIFIIAGCCACVRRSRRGRAAAAQTRCANGTNYALVSEDKSSTSAHVKCPSCAVILRVPEDPNVSVFRCPCGQLQRAPVRQSKKQISAITVVQGTFVSDDDKLDGQAVVHVVATAPPMGIMDEEEGGPVVGMPVHHL